MAIVAGMANTVKSENNYRSRVVQRTALGTCKSLKSPPDTNCSSLAISRRWKGLLLLCLSSLFPFRNGLCEARLIWFKALEMELTWSILLEGVPFSFASLVGW